LPNLSNAPAPDRVLGCGKPVPQVRQHVLHQRLVPAHPLGCLFQGVLFEGEALILRQAQAQADRPDEGPAGDAPPF
jgi:hypothetical protein